MDWKPLYDRVLIKPVSAEQNIGGLFIPAKANNFKRGVVELAGPGRNGVPMTCVTGQAVMFKADDATPITLEGVDYFIMLEKDIWLGN